MSDFRKEINRADREYALHSESESEATASFDDIDLSVLLSFEEAQCEGEPDLIVELIDLYLADFPQQLSAMTAGVLKDDEISLKRAAHTLKGSSANLGVKSIAVLCEELEQSGSGELTQKRDIINRLEQIFARLRSLLLAERQKRLQTPQQHEVL